MTPDKILAAIDAAFAASPAPPTSGDIAAAVLRAVIPEIQICAGPIAHPNPYGEGLQDRERNIVMMLTIAADQLDGALSQGEQATAANGELAIASEAQKPTNPFDVVQKHLAELAGGEELMVYYWPSDKSWDVSCGNPSASVMLGEVGGEYGAGGETLQEAVDKLAALIARNATG